jgi:hypothetical protein
MMARPRKVIHREDLLKKVKEFRKGGKTWKEISSFLGLPKSTITSIWSQERNKLKERIKYLL